MSPVALTKYLGSTTLLVAFALSTLSSNPGVQGKSVSAERFPCERGCLEIYDPLCGTDGKTYGNKCTLLVANNCDDTSPDRIRKAYDGECKAVEYPDRPTCIQEFLASCISPQVLVCGDDGIVYGDFCQLKAKNKCDGTAIGSHICTERDD
uniref:Kazal-like domain-containing protein n=1 Tax=Daphnia galeata TaxID=27404 RepID=A0A8J2S6J1_9CRUS|nr:unnamed protein product [Daphnia galeata]